MITQNGKTPILEKRINKERAYFMGFATDESLNESLIDTGVSGVTHDRTRASQITGASASEDWSLWW